MSYQQRKHISCMIHPKKSPRMCLRSAFDAAFRRAIHSSHHFFGEVNNQITNYKSQIFLFQVIKNVLYSSVAIGNLLVIWNATELYSTFGDLKQKNWWFEIVDLVGDFTKKLVFRMDDAPKRINLISVYNHIIVCVLSSAHGIPPPSYEPPSEDNKPQETFTR